ncbi:hypothetical protein I3843_02G137400 [Carya illinoinensis]|nr:hypothetical protein I3760_02G159400 [Carya illinoinensis]KAG7992643.1 hypothetical protein I3843_02G137400 [Carya illinoinensis]
MDTNNWRPTSGQGPVGGIGGGGGVGEPTMDAGDWRTELQPEARQRIVSKIMDTLKRHLPVSGQEGLQELRKIAIRFEEKIFTAATSQGDYLRKISLKMLTMETKSQNPPVNSLPPNSTGNGNKPPDPGMSGMQSQLHNQGQPLPIPLSANPSQSRQLLSQNIQNSVSSAGVQATPTLPSALTPASSINQTSIPNAVGQNTNVQNISGTSQNSVGNSMGQGIPSNMFANNPRQMQGRQQVVSQQQQQQQQQSQNPQQYMYQQQLQQHFLKQKFQQVNIPHSLVQSHIQQQQNLLQTNQMQSPQQSVMQTSSVMQPSLSGLQQNQQPSIRQATHSMLQQHPPSVLRQQPQQAAVIHPQQAPMQHQSILPPQQPNAANMQQNQLIAQQSVVGDMQQQQRLLGQQNNLQTMQQQQHQQQLMAQKNNFSSMNQQQLGSQSNVSGLQQQLLGAQSVNSSMQTTQHAVHMHSMQQSQPQITQIQPHESQMNPQLQSMSLQGSVATMQQNNMTSLQHNSLSSLSGVSTTQQNMMNSLQPGTNLDSGQGNTMRQVQPGAMGSLQQNPVTSSQQANVSTLSSQSGLRGLQPNINPLQSNSNILQQQHLKQQQEQQMLQTQQFKQQIHQRQMQHQLMQKQQIMQHQQQQQQQQHQQQHQQQQQQHQQQQLHQQPKQQLSAQLHTHQISQIHQINDVSDLKMRQGLGVKPGVFQQHLSAGQRAAYSHQQLKLGGSFPISSPQLQVASPQILQHSSPQIDQQNVLSSLTKVGTPLQSASSPFVVPSPSTPLAPSPMPGDAEKPISSVSSHSNAGNIGHQQTSGVGAPVPSLAIGTPGISASPLLAEFTGQDGTLGNALMNVSGKSSITEQPLERLIKAVKSMSPKALSASVSDIGSDVSMIDRIASSAPGNGSRATVGEDLVAMTKCRLQARNFITQDGTNGPLVFTQYTELMNGIIDTEEDVKALRESGILLNCLKSDAEVTNLWNGMSKSIRLTKVPFLDKVIEDVNKHHSGRWSVKVGNAFKLYVVGSWQFLALLAVIFLLLLMILQAF